MVELESNNLNLLEKLITKECTELECTDNATTYTYVRCEGVTICAATFGIQNGRSYVMIIFSHV